MVQLNKRTRNKERRGAVFMSCQANPQHILFVGVRTNNNKSMMTLALPKEKRRNENAIIESSIGRMVETHWHLVTMNMARTRTTSEE